MIIRGGRPVARLVPTSVTPRVLGRERGQIWMAHHFNEPMPDDWLASQDRDGDVELLPD